MRNVRTSDLEKSIRYSFQEKDILLQALTHSTFAHENKSRKAICDNERLEFLGDGLLDFVVAEQLYLLCNDQNEGYLSKTRALVVCETSLAEKALEISLGDYLLLGKGELQTGGKEKPSNLANAMEAVFAAVFLDGGFENAKAVILHLMFPVIQQAIGGSIVFDYKSRILELVQSQKDHTLSFSIIEEEGPVHERQYTAGLYLDGNMISTGNGLSKKLAEQAAAKSGFERARQILH